MNQNEFISSSSGTTITSSSSNNNNFRVFHSFTVLHIYSILLVVAFTSSIYYFHPSLVFRPRIYTPKIAKHLIFDKQLWKVFIQALYAFQLQNLWEIILSNLAGCCHNSIYYYYYYLWLIIAKFISCAHLFQCCVCVFARTNNAQSSLFLFAQYHFGEFGIYGILTWRDEIGSDEWVGA